MFIYLGEIIKTTSWHGNTSLIFNLFYNNNNIFWILIFLNWTMDESKTQLQLIAKSLLDLQ